jgi:hypothetical protein
MLDTKSLGIGETAPELIGLEDAKPYRQENYVRVRKKFQSRIRKTSNSIFDFQTSSFSTIIQNGCGKAYEEAGHA